MAGVSVRVDLAGVQQRLSRGNIQRGQYLMANQMLVDMNENFVPMRDQYLRDSGHVIANGDGLEWTTRYARRHYYNMFSNYTTPGTGPFWDKKASGLFMHQWIQVFVRGAGFN